MFLKEIRIMTCVPAWKGSVFCGKQTGSLNFASMGCICQPWAVLACSVCPWMPWLFCLTVFCSLEFSEVAFCRLLIQINSSKNIRSLMKKILGLQLKLDGSHQYELVHSEWSAKPLKWYIHDIRIIKNFPSKIGSVIVDTSYMKPFLNLYLFM